MNNILLSLIPLKDFEAQIKVCMKTKLQNTVPTISGLRLSLLRKLLSLLFNQIYKWQN